MDNMNEGTDRELLSSILDVQRRSLRNARVTSAVCIAIAAVMVLLTLLILPRAAVLTGKAETALEGLQNVMEKTEGLDDVIAGVKDFAGKLDGLVGESGALTGAAAKLGSIDIDAFNSGVREICKIDITTLNKAISELAAVIQPLARLANMFG